MFQVQDFKIRCLGHYAFQGPCLPCPGPFHKGRLCQGGETGTLSAYFELSVDQGNERERAHALQRPPLCPFRASEIHALRLPLTSLTCTVCPFVALPHAAMTRPLALLLLSFACLNGHVAAVTVRSDDWQVGAPSPRDMAHVLLPTTSVDHVSHLPWPACAVSVCAGGEGAGHGAQLLAVHHHQPRTSPRGTSRIWTSHRSW
jgi:hypothetical protein